MKIIYKQNENTENSKIVRKVNITIDNEDELSFNFLYEPKNRIKIFFNKKKEALTVSRIGDINYKIKHQKNKSSVQNIEILDSETLTVFIKTMNIKIFEDEQKIHIINEYIIDNTKKKDEYIIER